ncbi:unnamed protein product [Mytilus coruscus]|uniref:Uncharacterized protein n=1 Tax=Mytilus coruscus TaxID=42192 RepID=A0A6J8C6Q0_MYTCO|nr:unnamed protein product [Mytilus coruscus]
MMPETVPLEHTVSTTPTTSSGAPPVRATQTTSTNVLQLEPVADEQTDPFDGLQHVHNLADYLVQLDATRSLNANRYMEEVIKCLLERYPTPQKRPKGTLTRWTLILNGYDRIRRAVIDNRVMTLTALQLLAINNTTLVSWYKQRKKSEEKLILSQGIEVSTPSFIAPATEPVPAALGRPVTLTSQPIAPQFTFILPPNTAGMSKVRVRCPKPPQNTAIPQSQIFQIQMTVQNRMPCPLNPRGATRQTPVIHPAPLPTSTTCAEDTKVYNQLS